MKIINELLVNNVNESIKFYKDFIGFEIVETIGNPINLVRLKNGDAELMLEDYKSAMKEFVKFPPKANSSNLIKFKYNNKEEVRIVYNKILNSSINIFAHLKETDYGTTEFAILDCDNNIIII